MMLRTTEQVGEPALLYNGCVLFGVMQGIGARLARVDKHGWQKRVVHHPPPPPPPLVLPPLHGGIQLVVFDAQLLQAQGLPSSR